MNFIYLYNLSIVLAPHYTTLSLNQIVSTYHLYFNNFYIIIFKCSILYYIKMFNYLLLIIYNIFSYINYLFCLTYLVFEIMLYKY